jgi:hypothetical protein
VVSSQRDRTVRRPVRVPLQTTTRLFRHFLRVCLLFFFILSLFFFLFPCLPWSHLQID